jgi:integrase
MPSVKLTKSVVDAAKPRDTAFELRDTQVAGFLCKVTPAGRKVFMVGYRTRSGQRRKPAIGTYGELTVHQARDIAQDWLSEVRKGGDPSGERIAARHAYSVSELCDRFISEYSERHNKRSTVKSNRQFIDGRIKPNLGSRKVEDVSRADITALMKKYAYGPTSANRMLSLLRKMFNCAEVWQIRSEGTNPCRLIPKFPENGRTRLLTDDEVRRIFQALDEVEYERAMHPTHTLAIRLQFALAARMSEICNLQWDWIDWNRKSITWPDSKTGGLTKLIGNEVIDLLKTADRSSSSEFVCPAMKDTSRPLGKFTYSHAWARILKKAEVLHVGTHGIRHRAATDIANSVTNIRTGMAMTGHQTVTMFMRYVHPEAERIRQATEAVSVQRQKILSGQSDESE